MSNSQTPEPAGPGYGTRSSVRNPRRRQRPSDGESLRAGPRRKRSKLSAGTFAPRDTVDSEEHVEEGNRNVTVNGFQSSGGRKASGLLSMWATDHSAPAVDMPMRGAKKGTVKRAMKGDGATILTANKLYSVKLLPSTPRELREKDVHYRGSLYSNAHHHLALALTRQNAWIWDYTAHTMVSNARVFDVPFPGREDEALPFGALVAASGSAGAQSDVGLLLVSATSGKVIYYESIERAVSLGLFQERKTSVEGLITGFTSSETVTELTSAEHAGFVLTLSSGRVIQLTLRDTQGKARILTQVLRSENVASGGVFGSIKGLLSGSWKRGVVALRTRSLDQRGQMQAIALTERFEIQIWDIDWTGRQVHRNSVDMREMMTDEMRSLESPETQGRVETLVAMDFVITDRPAYARGEDVATLGSEQPISMIMLVRVGSTDQQSFSLVEVNLSGASAVIDRILKLDSYQGQGMSMQRPRILLPRPGHTAVVAFDNGIVLVSMTVPETTDDPNAQLHGESYLEPRAFEDAVYLRSDRNLGILGACTEDTRSGHASSIAFIKGAGLVRLSVTDPAGDKERERLPAKEKLEEAVWYGAMPGNILDFSRKASDFYSVEEMERAALIISEGILESESEFISSSPPSIRDHLDTRASALRTLVTNVRQNFPAISRQVMWQLLWDAERIAAAQAIWKTFEKHKEAAKSRGEKKGATVLDVICNQHDLDSSIVSIEESDKDDVTRRFFIRGLAKIEKVLCRIRNLLQEFQNKQRETPERKMKLVAEADELWIAALEGTFTFREENAAAYGIATEFMTDGVLNDPAEYTQLSEFWTSSTELLKASSKVATLSRDLAKNFFEQADPAPEIEDQIKVITLLNPRLIQLCCQIYRERIGWLASRPLPKDREFALSLEENYKIERHEQFRDLAAIGQASAGMALAEKYKDMVTLTELVVMETQYYMEALEEKTLPEQQRIHIAETLNEMTVRTSRYFEKFGDDWANAFFDQAFGGERAGVMLSEAQIYWKEALTAYLRADLSRGKLCWINDVDIAQDYGHAGYVLAATAKHREAKLWAKKVELSMSKLALLADHEASRDDKVVKLVREQERELKIVEVQEKLFLCLRREVFSALDHQAEVELAMAKFGTRIPRQYSAFRQLLEIIIDRVLNHQALSVEELIDVLTLMDSRVYNVESDEPDGNLEGMEFVLALKALDAAAATMPPERFDTLLKLIWKRCYVYDDWVAITSNQSKKGKTESDMKAELLATAPWRTFYALHDDGVLDHPDTAIRVLAPSECLGAACRAEDLAYRFPSESLLDPIVHDHRIQDEMLQSYVTDRHLDEWIADCEADAKRAADAKLEQEADVSAMERELQREVEEGNVKANGHL
ncbi:hypothetical protein M433DRAFT_149048 [Acidomyces richmondensis BFW]|nr:MAG: hypothetical protein FE78DRAFT_86654 [Acidomyces sp. 'richmondensis']KYG50293.1 hypothetical protein M433DRAFT_149048 [Acidomyces richmondensis BFW]